MNDFYVYRWIRPDTGAVFTSVKAEDGEMFSTRSTTNFSCALSIS